MQLASWQSKQALNRYVTSATDERARNADRHPIKGGQL